MVSKAGRVVIDKRPTRQRARALIKLAKRMIDDPKHYNAGPRIKYATHAVSALLERCAAAIGASETTRNDSLPRLFAMPRPLITPFNLKYWKAHLPSEFELHATWFDVAEKDIATDSLERRFAIRFDREYLQDWRDLCT